MVRHKNGSLKKEKKTKKTELQGAHSTQGIRKKSGEKAQ